MIIEEYLNEMVRHYSDEGKTLIQIETGIQYSDAIDKLPCRYTYREVSE